MPFFLIYPIKKNYIYVLLTDMKKTILFVDDEEVNLFVFSKRFQDEYNVLTCSNGEEAIKKVKENKGEIQAVISDVKMPDMSGIQMIDSLSEYLNDTPCFLLTGYDEIEKMKDHFSEVYIKKVFKKPFNHNEIKAALKEYIH